MTTYIASCALGLEKVLANELRALKFTIQKDEHGRLFFSGDGPSVPYRANLALRTAERVMLLAAEFPAPEFGALFDGVAGIPWEDYVSWRSRIVIDTVRTHGSALTSVPTIQAVVQKAVSERLCRKAGIERLPEIGATVGIRVYIEHDRAEICLDLSGEALHRRGYRKEAGPAPLKESVAAGIVLLSNWRRKYRLLDPFCGSGTIPIEAALYALNVAPGIGRQFAIENLEFYDAGIDKDTRGELTAAIRPDCRVRIAGSDIDPQAVEIAERNVALAFKMAGLPAERYRDYVRFSVRPMETLASEDDEPGFIVTNPPYGERLGDAEKAADIYRAFGTTAREFPGWTIATLSTHQGFEEAFGRKADDVREVLNGASRARLYVYRGIGKA